MASAAVLIGVPRPRPTLLPDGTVMEWAELRGVENDLAAVRSMLLQAVPQPLKAISIITLVEPSDTTAANINSRLDHYVGQLKPGDTFILVLNGHGYHVQDVDGDEGTGDPWDEVFIASDGQPILDDEFSKRWNQLDKEVTIIGLVDTCFADTSGLFIDHPARLLSRSDLPATYRQADGATRLFFFASLAGEKAYETNLTDGPRGVLSAALTDVWSMTEGARESYATLFGYAHQLAKQYDRRQTTRVRIAGQELLPLLARPPFSIAQPTTAVASKKVV